MPKDRPPYTPNRHSTENGMNLPDGKTCGDCAHFPRCEKLIGQIAADQICDWAPSRFHESRASVERGAALAQLERDCAVLCDWCRHEQLDDNPPGVFGIGKAGPNEFDSGWRHQVTQAGGGIRFEWCSATPLLVAHAEAMKAVGA